jgi:flagellar hook-associated protein 2
MAGLSLGGVNLDVQGLVSQLMQLESRPLQRLQTKESEYQSQLSAFGRLNSALSSFQTSMGNLASLDNFEKYKVSTSESDTDQSYTATVDKDATAATFNIEVTQLALGTKYGSDNSNPFADTNTTAINTSGDPLSISVGATSMDVNVDGLTLQDARDAINAAAETNDLSVSASIVSTKSNEHFLVITGGETGTDNAVTITDNNAKTALQFGTGTVMEIQSAQNSNVVVDNQYTISNSSNTVTDAISGVTLNLLKVSGSSADMIIERDTAAVKKSIGTFVSAFNTLHSTTNALKESGLEGDSITNSILTSIRGELNSSAGLSGAFNYLSEIGITSNAKTGDLELDDDVFEKAMAQDYEAISQLFANDNKGVAFRLEEKMDEYLSFDGLIKTREEGLKSRISFNGDAQLRMEYRLEQTESRLLKQFSYLGTHIVQ